MQSRINISADEMFDIESIISSIIKASLATNSFVKVVKVTSVDIENQTVTIVPLVNMQSSNDIFVNHAEVFNIKYIRIQSGQSAIVIDPTIGDIGIALVCDEDITTVKATKDFSPPSTFRRHSLSDSVYLCGILNQTPKQIIKFTNDGIEINSPIKITAIAPVIEAETDELTATVTGNATIDAAVIDLIGQSAINLTAPQIGLNGALTASPLNGSGTATINMPLNATDEITANGIALSTHTHGNVQNGDGNTGGPQ